MSEIEHPLPGGNVSGAVRIGTTVRRTAGPWTPAVTELLEHLHGQGVGGVPGPHGLDDRGREVLDYLPGEVIDVDHETLGLERLASVGAWLREFHDAVTPFRPGPRRWHFGTSELAASQIVCHHDAGAYNMAFDGDRLAGVFDWEMAGPGVPVDDVAFFAWTGIPLFREVEGWEAGDVAARLRVLTDAYGDPGVTPGRVLRHATRRMTTACERIAAGQAAGDPGMIRLGVVAGEPARTRARVASVRERLPAVLAALASRGT